MSDVPPTAHGSLVTQRIGFVLGFGCLAAVWLVVMGLMVYYRAPLGPALFLTILFSGLAVARPHVALGATIIAGIVGDPISMGWWPATKNLSSSESIFYLSDALIIKPVDIVLIIVLATILLQSRLSPNAARLRFGPLAGPMSIFGLTIIGGLVWGLARGGDVRVAYFESAPLIYIPVVYVAAVNLFTSLAHYRRLLIWTMVALTVEALHIITRLPELRTRIGPGQSPFEHTAATHFNLAILLAIAVGWFGAKKHWPRPVLLLPLLPIVFVYIDGQRRSGVVALIIGGLVLSSILYARDKKRFFRTVPALALVGVLYLGAFWTSNSGVAFPAQAVRGVVQPDSASEADSLSELYRDFENFDLNATIRTNPVLGIGFGQPFLQPIPLPEIEAFFEFADYIPHNIMLWIWLKTGVVGFISFTYMGAMACAMGVRAAVRLRHPTDVAVISTLVTFVPMALVVAFVEIAIDSTTMMLLGLALAAASTAEHLEPADPTDPADQADVIDGLSSNEVDGEAPDGPVVGAGVGVGGRQ